MREVIFSEPRYWATRCIESLFVNIDGGTYDLSSTARIVHVRSYNHNTVEIAYEREFEELETRRVEFSILRHGAVVPANCHLIASFPDVSDHKILHHMYFRYVDN